MTGTTVSHYRILEKLGSGGMGVVYKAEDTRLKRFVALKFLPAKLARGRPALGRFQREARAASSLDHPNICTIYDIGEHAGAPYIVMQFLEGRTLRSRIDVGRISAQELLDIGSQIVAGLKAAHERGIVHRDIKPENIFLTKDGYAKILDFGLAKLRSDNLRAGEVAEETKTLTGSGGIIGTIGYMSPEQALGRDLDGRADLFSLGAVLYEMATEQGAFSGDTVAATIEAVLHRTPKLVSRPDVCFPAELERIINKALEKSPDLRYQTATDLGLDLVRLKRETVSISGQEFDFANYPVPKRNAFSRFWALGGVLLVLVAILLAYGREWSWNDGAIHSVAVIPFTNLNGDANTEYLCEFLAQNITESLAQLPDPELSVKSWHVSSRFRDEVEDFGEVGRELGVEAILIGKVLQREDQLIINVELTDTRDQKHIWGDQYSCDVSQLFALQEGISEEITENLRLRLSGQERRDLEVYQLYRSGRYHMDRRTADGLRQAIEILTRVIEMEPGHARSHAALANCYALLNYYASLPPSQAFPRAKAEAQKAIDLDESLAEAHTALALVRRDWDRDWVDAEREYRRALELDPNYETAHQWYAEYLTAVGRFDEALEEIDQAEKLDPLSLIVKATRGWVLYSARRTDEAIAQLQETLQMDPNFVVARWFLGWAYAAANDYPSAIRELELANSLSEDRARMIADLGFVYGISGNREEAARLLQELEQMAGQRSYVSQYAFAVVYAGLGDRDQAFSFLRKAAEDRAWEVSLVNVDPMMDPLRADERFPDLVRSLGLVPQVSPPDHLW